MWGVRRRVCVYVAALLAAFILASSGFGSEVSFTKALAPGVVLKQVVKRSAPAMVINVLEVDPKAAGVKLKCVPAQSLAENNPTKRRDTVSSIAARIGCLAAVNASFFNMQTADTIGLFVADGELLSEPYPNWVCVGWDSEGKVMVDVVAMQASVEAGGRNFPISGLNRTRRRNELVVYTRAYGPTTPNNASGNEAVIEGTPVPFRPGVFEGRVSQVRTYAGSAPIPADGLVLSGHGPAAEFVGSLKQGDVVRISVSLRGSGGQSWDSVPNAVSGSQYLVKDGKPETANLNPASDARHPRTVLGVTPYGGILIVTVDGRQSISAGMSLREAADLMVKLGAATAVNLDGGGSTTLAVRGIVLNSPSGGKQRPVTNVLAVFAQEETKAASVALSISPPKAEVASGASVQFSVGAADASGNPVDVRPEDVLWGVDGGVGFVNQGGEFTGVKAGSGSVVAWLRGSTAKAEVVVTAGAPASIAVKAQPDAMDPLRFRITASVKDANGNPVPKAVVRFSPSEGGQAVPGEIETDASGTAVSDVVWERSLPNLAVSVACGDLKPVKVECKPKTAKPAGTISR